MSVHKKYPSIFSAVLFNQKILKQPAQRTTSSIAERRNQLCPPITKRVVGFMLVIKEQVTHLQGVEKEIIHRQRCAVSEKTFYD